MDYRLLRHATRRARTRGVTLAMVDDVLQKPGQVVGAKGGRKAYQSRITLRGKPFLLRAIVDDTVAPAIVVTVYATDKIAKYWRP